MKPLIYMETSIVSYLTARPSHDLLTAARQRWTREWWEVAFKHWEMAISKLVVEEAGRGNPLAATRRLDVLHGLCLLPVNAEARILAATLIDAGALPPTEPEDALHISIATIAGARYLVTWNFAHLVGPEAKSRLTDALRACGKDSPLLTTPEELLEMIML
jgi:hypothetical protein